MGPTHTLIVGGSRADRLRVGLSEERAAAHSSQIRLDPAALPFVRPGPTHLRGAGPHLLRVDDFESACPNRQAAGIRLVLTQSTYVLQAWIDALGPTGRLVLTADREALERQAPEAFARRGPWRLFNIVEAAQGGVIPPRLVDVGQEDSTVALLIEAFTTPSSNERLKLCRRASASSPDSAVAALALASACREHQDAEGARAALAVAERCAPDWAAVPYEAGKFWLGFDDMERARAAFERSVHLMPALASAHSNLGAVLGELDEPFAAMSAFARALTCDPESFTLQNNVGVLHRELGRLDESERALTRVTQMAPGFVFGHYNLGHTRFLQGNYPGAREAYEEGRRRDPDKNRRQGARLAMVCLADGDIERAERDFWPLADAAPADERNDLLLEAYDTATALLATHPQLARGRAFVDRIGAAVTL